jgi:parallel beta-helix repeat protein
MKRVRPVLGVLAVLGMTAAYMFAAAPPAAAATINVPSDYPTIQAAVIAANPGDTIIVQPGTYNESVVVTKSIKIHGAPNQPNPVVEGAGLASDSGCGDVVGELDGFCIFPTGPAPIQNVEIDHFTIQNFSGSGIIAVSAVGLNFHDNTSIDNEEYGIARFDSSQTQIVHNDVSGSHEAGIYVGDSPNASALVRINNVHDNPGLGIFLRDSSHGTVSENTANNNCWGILLIDTGAPGQTFDWLLVHNTANNNTLACPPGDESPPTSGAGIVVAGANHARLTANTANGNVASDDSIASGGIVVRDASFAFGPDPSYVQIDNNHAFLNLPYDLSWDLSGNHITFFSNHCGTSSPSGLCVP